MLLILTIAPVIINNRRITLHTLTGLFIQFFQKAIPSIIILICPIAADQVSLAASRQNE